MKIAVGMMTWQAITYGRIPLLERTYISLAKAGVPITLIDNGSTDGTEKVVTELGGRVVMDGLGTPGAGLNAAVHVALEHDPDIVVFSEDDIEWHEGWLEKVQDFWLHAPEDVILACGYIEPNYPWSAPRELISVGSQAAWIRTSVPGGAWTFRAHDWRMIGPVPDHSLDGHDTSTCYRLLYHKYRMAALDWATNIGEGFSTVDRSNYSGYGIEYPKLPTPEEVLKT